MIKVVDMIQMSIIYLKKNFVFFNFISFGAFLTLKWRLKCGHVLSWPHYADSLDSTDELCLVTLGLVGFKNLLHFDWE